MLRTLRVLLTIAFLLGAPTAAGADAAGFLYGTVELTDGSSLTGLLRWGGEEAFWDDLFNGGKVDRPSARHARRLDEGSLESWLTGLRRIFGGDDGRQVVARFGDLEAIEVRGGGGMLELKSGSRLRFSDDSNDVGATVTVWRDDGGREEIDWRRIDRVAFASTPESVRPEGYRLRGRVETRIGRFEGWVAWNGEKGLSSDRLHGFDEEGRHEIPFREIRSIRRESSRRALVTLRDGGELALGGSSDVTSSNYGLFVEDPRYGRVRVGWRSLRSLEIEPRADSGAGYDDYRPTAGHLDGVVTTDDGERLSGRLVLDLDESEPWELLNGYDEEVEYSIPLSRISSIEPTGRGSEVTLRDGTLLSLERTVDVGPDNAGVLVDPQSGREVLVPWRLVRRLELGAADRAAAAR